MLKEIQKSVHKRFLEIRNCAERLGYTPSQADRIAKILMAATITDVESDVKLVGNRLFPVA